jgi:SAM-dependent methyltransferase
MTIALNRAGAERVGNYAELTGAEGRDVLFRPDRYRRSELGPIHPTLELTIAGRSHQADLVDVSRTGVALAWPEGLPAEIGIDVPELTVTFDRHQAYHGAARVSSLRRMEGATVAGLSLAGPELDIEAVLQLRSVEAWAGSPDGADAGAGRAPWRIPGHDKFKAAVSEMRLLLADAQDRFEKLESELPWSVVHGEGRSPARDALIERVRREFVSEVVAYSTEADLALRAASPGERPALHAFSLRHLDEALMQTPWMHRARHKPLGYPGDFEVMNFLYTNRFSGSTLFAKAVGFAFICTPASQAVSARKDLIKERLSALIDDPSSTGPVRILSIAAGPAQEVVELLEERTSWPRPVEFVLFDQDKRALSYAHGKLSRLLAARPDAPVKIVYLHDSIRRLLRGAEALSGQGTFDAVYSAGLFDYLQTLTAVSLCRSLYRLVAPGGTLYVGNMVPDNPSRWAMEVHLDWYLIYRQPGELYEIGRAAAPEAELELLYERTRVNPFIALRRPMPR